MTDWLCDIRFGLIFTVSPNPDVDCCAHYALNKSKSFWINKNIVHSKCWALKERNKNQNKFICVILLSISFINKL